MFLPLILFIVSVFAVQGQDNIKNEVKITLFYETFCPYCIKFVTEQLYETNKYLSKYINLDLVPYGKTKSEFVNGRWVYKCQHGVEECYGNKIHACVLEQMTAKGQNYVLEGLNCLMSTQYSDSDIKKCTYRSNLDYSRIKRCMLTTANGLISKYRTRTENNDPQITFVPFLMFNDYFNQTLDEKGTDHLMDTVCSILNDPLPDECNSIDVDRKKVKL